MDNAKWFLTQFPRALFFWLGMFAGAAAYAVAQIVTLAIIGALNT